MKKTYVAPTAEITNFDTEEVLGISFTGTGTVLDEKNAADKTAASDFGNVSLF